MAEGKFSMNPGIKFKSRSALGVAAENVSEPGDDPDDAEDDHHGGLGVQPGVEEVADSAADDDAADKNEGELHGQRVLLREVSRLLHGRRNFRVGFIVGFRGHSERAWRMAQDTAPRRELQTGPRRGRSLEHWSSRARAHRRALSTSRERRSGNNSRQR